MKMNLNKLFSLLTLLFFWFACPFAQALATGEDGEVGFNIQMVPAENQLHAEYSFFDLRMKPDQKQTIFVQIHNTSDEETEYTIQINQAYTNDQGFIDYSDQKKSLENNYTYKIADIASYDKILKLNGGETKNIPIELQMPKESFDGELLAGIQINKKMKNQEATDEIKNSYGYILGLKLTETDQPVSRELKLKGIAPEVKFGNPAVVATIENPKMAAYGHLRYDVDVVEKGSNTSVFQKNYDNNMEIAPDSTYPFAIEFTNQKLVAGTYTLNLTISDAQNNRWSFVEDFEITSSQANQINQATIEKDETPKLTEWIWGGLALMVALMLATAGWIFLKKRKKASQAK